ncbi:MAG: hypothetical protein RLZZ206_2271, partial [Cyanobacteriota bacterium]
RRPSRVTQAAGGWGEEPPATGAGAGASPAAPRAGGLEGWSPVGLEGLVGPFGVGPATAAAGSGLADAPPLSPAQGAGERDNPSSSTSPSSGSKRRSRRGNRPAIHRGIGAAIDVRRGTARSWRGWPAAPTVQAAYVAGEPFSRPTMRPAAPHQRPPAERLEAAACLGWLGRLPDAGTGGQPGRSWR